MRPDAITVTADLGASSERVLAADFHTLEAGLPVLADSVRVRWSRPASVLAPDPTEASLTILKPIDHLWPDVRIDTRLTITWTHGGTTTTVFDGYIDVMTSHPPEGRRVAGRRVHRVTIEAICPIGRYSRIRFGEPPWNQTDSSRRAVLLRPYLPDTNWSTWGLGEITQPPNTDDRYTMAVAIDVDSRSPVEVAQQLVAGHRRVLVAGTSPEEPTIEHVEISERRLGAIEKVAGGNFEYVPASGQVESVQLPAWAVDDTTRTQSFDSAISSVTVRYHLVAQGAPHLHREVSRTWGDPTAPGTSIAVQTQSATLQYITSYTDEQFDALQPEEPLHADFWASLVRPNSRDIVRLGPVRIPLSRLGDEYGPALHTLTDIYGRWGTAVHFTGTPPDVSPLQVPIGGVLTLSGDPARSQLKLDLEPFELSATESVAWQEFGVGTGTAALYQAAFTFHESTYASEVNN